MIPLRLPHAVKDLFGDWLATHYPDTKDKVLNRLRSMHGERLNDPRFGHRMTGEGVFAEQMQRLFELACRRHRLATRAPALNAGAFARPRAQLALFT